MNDCIGCEQRLVEIVDGRIQCAECGEAYLEDAPVEPLPVMEPPPLPDVGYYNQISSVLVPVGMEVKWVKGDHGVVTGYNLMPIGEKQ